MKSPKTPKKWFKQLNRWPIGVGAVGKRCPLFRVFIFNLHKEIDKKRGIATPPFPDSERYPVASPEMKRAYERPYESTLYLLFLLGARIIGDIK